MFKYKPKLLTEQEQSCSHTQLLNLYSQDILTVFKLLATDAGINTVTFSSIEVWYETEAIYEQCFQHYLSCSADNAIPQQKELR